MFTVSHKGIFFVHKNFVCINCDKHERIIKNIHPILSREKFSVHFPPYLIHKRHYSTTRILFLLKTKARIAPAKPNDMKE